MKNYVKNLVIKNRSYRRFHQEVFISENDLKELIDCARLSASAKNAQSLKYIISNYSAFNEIIFSTLAWAGYLKDWPGPEEGERPSAYIIMLNDKTITDYYFCDHGIAAQSILLSAVEKGYGGCIIASVKTDELSRALKIPDYLEIIQVIALGKPKETVVIDTIKEGDYKYWRDKNQVHHVPKRNLEEIILGINQPIDKNEK